MISQDKADPLVRLGDADDDVDDKTLPSLNSRNHILCLRHPMNLDEESSG